MLKRRIIPTLLMKNMGLVKDVEFKSERRVGSILPQIKVYNMREVDELIIIDVSASIEKKEINYSEVHEFSKFNFVPLTVGGGISSLIQIEKLLSNGADKVTINTITYYDINFVKEAVRNFGSQCIIGSIDYRNINNNRICYSHSGTINQGLDLIERIKNLEDLGVGELLITAIDLDGKMKGYDLNIVNEISENTNVPIIISGGAGSYKDILDCLNEGCDAVAAASIFHFTELTPYGAKLFLSENNIPVRS